MRGRLGQWHCPKFGSIFYFKHIFHQHLSLSNNQRVKIIQNFPFWHSMRLWQRSPFASILKQGLILSTLLHTCMYVYIIRTSFDAKTSWIFSSMQTQVYGSDVYIWILLYKLHIYLQCQWYELSVCREEPIFLNLQKQLKLVYILNLL